MVLEADEGSVKPHSRHWLKVLALVLLCCDAAGVVKFMAAEPAFFQSLLVGVSSIAAAVAAVAKFLGLAKEDRLTIGFESVEELLGDGKFQLSLLILSGFLWVSILYPPFLRPQTELTVFVVSKEGRALKGELAGAVELLVKLENSGDQEKQGLDFEQRALQPVRFYEKTKFPAVRRDRTYQVTFVPFDKERFDTDGSVRNAWKASGSTRIETLQVLSKTHRVRFLRTPPGASFRVQEISAGGSPWISVVSQDAQLFKGAYRYSLEAPGYVTDTDSFSVPRIDTLRLQLQPVIVTLTFFADRSIQGGNPKPLRKAHFRIYEQDGRVFRTVGPGDSIGLILRKAYRIEASGSEEWDLAGRRYFGKRDLTITDDLRNVAVRVHVEEVR